MFEMLLDALPILFTRLIFSGNRIERDLLSPPHNNDIITRGVACGPDCFLP